MIIYGAGTVGRIVWEREKEWVTGFCDDNPTIKEFCGLPVYRIEDIPENTTFIISVADIGDVVNKLRKHGHNRYFTIDDTHSHFERYALEMAMVLAS